LGYTSALAFSWMAMNNSEGKVECEGTIYLSNGNESLAQRRLSTLRRRWRLGEWRSSKLLLILMSYCCDHRGLMDRCRGTRLARYFAASDTNVGIGPPSGNAAWRNRCRRQRISVGEGKSLLTCILIQTGVHYRHDIRRVQATDDVTGRRLFDIGCWFCVAVSALCKSRQCPNSSRCISLLEHSSGRNKAIY
jgi:hypothetical protein